MSMTHEQKISMLSYIDVIENMRIIQLNLNVTLCKKIRYLSLFKLRYYNDLHLNEKDFFRLQVLLPSTNLLEKWCVNIIHRLITSPINSFHGISIVTGQQMGNPMMLNVTRLTVLRQYYGVNDEIINSDIVYCATYRYNN